jgi:tRNA pseudouridine(38-40) synthase
LYVSGSFVTLGRSKNRKAKEAEVTYATMRATSSSQQSTYDDRARSAPPPTRSRSRSRARSFVYEPEETEEESTEPRFFDPIMIPYLTEERKSIMRRYRATPAQLDMLNNIIGIYKGTHNWHNFIPGASQQDQRCYMRVINMDCAAPEVHFGMEWIRVKVQAKAFARYQFRKMMALAIFVIRTNTPRSVIANSFGVSKIDIPEAPASGLILEQPFYDEYNNNSHANISFDDDKTPIERFRKSQVHDKIYRDEEDMMHFGEWLRSVDTYAFLYTHYLNQRGIIRAQTK